VSPLSEQSETGDSPTTPSAGESECREYVIAHDEAFLIWERRASPSREAIRQAEDWVNAVKLLGPDMIPHSSRIVRGREERTSLFADVDLVVTYRVLESPPCTVGIVDVSSISERGG
jgi:hypothetical protein